MKLSYEENSLISTPGIFYPGVIRDVRKSKAPLQPVFEAFINALEAIRDLPDGTSQGEILIKIFSKGNLVEPEFEYLSVEDNGIGFNEENFDRFLTFKDYRKGLGNKGSGRIQLLHFFEFSDYSSSYLEGESLKTREFSFSKSHAEQDPHALVFHKSTRDSNGGRRGTKLVLKGIAKRENVYYKFLTIEELKEKLSHHFLLDLCINRDHLPLIKLQHFVDGKLEGETQIEPLDIPAFDKEEALTIPYSTIDPETKAIVPTEKKEDFVLRAFKINKGKLKRNEIKLTSKNEIVEDVKIPLDCLSSEEHIDNNRYLFLLSGSYIEAKENEVRGEIDIPNRAEFLKDHENGLLSGEEILLDDIHQSVNEKVLGLYQEIQQKAKEHERDVDELKEMFLLDPESLKDTSIGLNDSEEGILAKVYKTESERVAKKDAAIKRKIDELDKLNPSDKDYGEHLEEVVTDLVKTIPESNRMALTHYVAKRRLVLELFRKILDRQLSVQETADRNSDETLLHNLIFQQSSDRPDQSDLWLFNEEFVYYSGSSNVQLRNLQFQGEKIMKDPLTAEEEAYRVSLGEDRLQKRPDILLFPNEGKCIIIEFKNPNENVSDHLAQINKYASWLRNLTKDKFAVDTFYGYLIGQNIDVRDVRAADSDFKHSSHFDYMFRPAKTVLGEFGRPDGSIYTEVLKYSTLLERASTRNKIFLDKIRNTDGIES